MVDTHKHKPDDEEIVAEAAEQSGELEVEEFENNIAEKLKKLRDALKESEREKAQLREDLQRARADFLNSKRRLDEQLERDRERIVERLVTNLLPLVDSFETAMSDQTAWSALDVKWRTGMEGIYAQLMSFLKSNHVEELRPIGALFNPHEHEAVTSVAVDNDAHVDTVITVLQKGFKRNDTIIRPAKVAVGIKH